MDDRIRKSGVHLRDIKYHIEHSSIDIWGADQFERGTTLPVLWARLTRYVGGRERTSIFERIKEHEQKGKGKSQAVV
jgi:hypothetical protein